MKALIINADDFGISSGVNQGIIKAFQDGILTSSTMMVNMGKTSKEASILALKNPRLGIGLHLNLTCGKPILPPDEIPSLVNSRGYFYNLRSLIIKLSLGMISTEDIKSEFDAQIKRLRKWGIETTHIDSHQHIHVHPKILKVLVDIAKENKIEKIRYPSQKKSINRFPFKQQNIKRILIKYLLKINGKLIFKKKLIVTNHFFGISEMESNNKLEVFKKLLISVKDGITEIMCHPGYCDEQLLKIDNYTFPREEELQALLSPELKKIIINQRISVINYGDI